MPVLIRIRFNTEHRTAPDSRLVWRVIIGDDLSPEHERLASDFTISGRMFSSRDTLPNGIDKWHVACRGVPEWNGTQLTVHA